MTANIVLAILVTSLATYISRFLGALTSEKIGETSKIYKWFNCVAYSRIIVILLSILIFYVTKRNLVYPTILSAIILATLNSFAV